MPNAIDQHRVETLGGSKFSPVAPAGGAGGILVQAETKNVRYVLSHGQAPTASIGFTLTAGNDPIYIPLGTNMDISFFRAEAGAILHYQWFGYDK